MTDSSPGAVRTRPATDPCGFVAPRWATWAWAVGWAAALLVPAWLDRPAHPALTGLGLLVVAACFVGATIRALRPDLAPRPVWPLLAAQVLVTGALALDPDRGWTPLPLALAIAVGATSRLRWAPWLVVVVAAGATVVEHARGATWVSASLATGVTVLLAGLLSTVLTWLGSVIGELVSTREQLARTAVTAERLRIARDLHDLLGHTLSVVVVKAEAARRVSRTDPDAAAGHAADIERIGREALIEVRQAVQGYRETSLEQELTRAEQALTAAGVRPELVRTAAGLTESQERLLGWAVREATTNVIRHADATRVTITIGEDAHGVSALVEDDGRGLPEHTGTGTGLLGLRERLHQCGGSLETSQDGAGFRLVARVPATLSTAEEPR